MRRKQRTLTNSNECDVIGQRTSGVFAHALNRLRCNGTPVYAMIDSRQIDLQLSFVHRSLSMTNICLLLVNRTCIVPESQASQGQRLVASHPHASASCTTGFCGSTTLKCHLICRR